MSDLTHAGLFEGIGGFSIAARNLGIKTVWFSEIHYYKKEILKQNFPEAKLYADIKKITTPEKADILTGGFPCPDISIAGQGSGIKGHRSNLWTEFFRIIETMRPGCVVIENSPQLINRGLEYILYDLAQIGYDAEWQVISASDFGFQHKRSRVFIVAYPMQNRQQRRSKGGYIFTHEINPVPGQANLSLLPKRIFRREDLPGVRTDARFHAELDKNRIEAVGDSVNVIVAGYVLSCVKDFLLKK